ncbi:MAG TPA: thymidine phosphorylase [Kiritimatiellia bacterium]|nr:thymidine phosphorylase [Kiritimatiellia bacterium]HNR93991.1 thymidine phosphorylase [Kiritimatiellia bacterium]HNS81726.1 thymidine phosphorylase [Kiritimatiellia bacterium]HPA78021.1 thymidine phosphorylase [Kiritimatiellia bacterium]HQQ04393.1 thymidine phosphorylase [Kiritimatiellia bacterium]
MVPQWIIEKKRDGEALSREEIEFFINGFTDGSIPDYQMAAMAMAIYLKGMTFDEVAVLTETMMNSGDIVDTSAIERPKVDKHSTGGIGDKVSLILAPLVACCGGGVPMISGRGLGITGGTLDKFEAIPGYRTDLSVEEFIGVVNKCGCSIIGQTGRLAPADKKLYALRDVTGTVPSIPLITASIMSKKMAAGLDALVLDVKWGKGAFMKTRENAKALALSMVEVGTRMGKGMAALITDMNQPLGRTAGNTVEIIETVKALSGEGAEDLMIVTMALSAQMLTLTGLAPGENAAMLMLEEKIRSGEALEKFKEMVQLHGGDVSSLEDFRKLPTAKTIQPMLSPKNGYIAAVDAEKIGKAVLLLGAGRMKTTDTVDHAVGATDLLKIGEQVSKGDPLLTMHINSTNRLAEAEKLFMDAFIFSDAPVSPPPFINELILPEE